MSERWVMFEPLDTVSVRDGRMFDAGQQSMARTVVPGPTTVAGAVGAAYQAPPGAGLRKEARGTLVPARLAGPFVVTDRGSRVLWPVPADVVREYEGSPPTRLVPEDAALREAEHDLEGAIGGLLAGLGTAAGGWWETAELVAYLERGAVSPDIVAEPPWTTERRVGLAGDEDGLAIEGMFYSADHLRLAEGAGFAVRCCDGPETGLAEIVPFGGQGRGARVHLISPPEVPGPAARAGGGRLLLYLTTPAVFAQGWRPDLSRWPGCELVTAALGDPQVITTITSDRATGGFRGRGRLMWAVPAGSVYYLRFPTEADALAAARELVWEPLDQAEETLATAGFGHTLTGSW